MFPWSGSKCLQCASDSLLKSATWLQSVVTFFQVLQSILQQQISGPDGSEQQAGGNQPVNSSRKLTGICAVRGWLFSLPREEDEWDKNTHFHQWRNYCVCGFHWTREKEDWEALIFIYLFSDTSAMFFSPFAILYFSQGEQRRRIVGVFFLNRF